MNADQTPSAENPLSVADIGLVDGSVAVSTRRFHAVLAEDAVAQLDDLVATRQTLPDGTELTHYGIVVEGLGEIEGAELPSDTHRISAARTMPGITSRRVEVQILRTVPELWLPAAPGAPVARVSAMQRREALFLDQMEQPLPIGLDQADEPVYADFAFLNGEKGGHASISGISGVATKTSYALFLLYMLFETDHGRALLGPAAPATFALVFNVKGEDLLHIDRPNTRFAAQEDAPRRWHALGVDEPGRFRRVRLYAPRSARCQRGAVATDVVSREASDVHAFGWSPMDFIRQGLLRFCFSAPEDARTHSSGKGCSASASARPRMRAPRSRSSSSACVSSWPAGPTRWRTRKVRSCSPSHRPGAPTTSTGSSRSGAIRGRPARARRYATSPTSSTF
jgi:hypothetical protein